jgi:hypothetical protein
MLTNPMDGEQVCNCDNVTVPIDVGFVVTSDCTKRDINECIINHGGCHERAECINYDATKGDLFSTCKCQVGWMGDGVNSCDFNQYTTVFRIKIEGPFTKSKSELIDQLSREGVLPLGLNINLVTISVVATFN